IDRSGVWGVKTSGRGFVLTRFLLPFHRLEKEEPVRLEDKNRSPSSRAIVSRGLMKVIPYFYTSSVITYYHEPQLQVS
ncbi:MAG: hypothetical protein WC384_08715, partial [Prolixibacteraceae bacterium]